MPVACEKAPWQQGGTSERRNRCVATTPVGRAESPAGVISLRDRNKSGQATKGIWWMSWRQKAMKGVEGCDKPGGAVKQALIPGFPNYRTVNP